MRYEPDNDELMDAVLLAANPNLCWRSHSNTNANKTSEIGPLPHFPVSTLASAIRSTAAENSIDDEVRPTKKDASVLTCL